MPRRPGPVEHRVSGRRPEGLRHGGRRRSAAEGAGLRFALPEPGDRTQHDAVRRQESRRRFLLHARRRRQNPAGQDPRRRPAELRLDDLCRAQEHDLCRRQARRSAQSKRPTNGFRRTTTCRATPAWAAPDCITTISCSPRRSTRSAPTRSKTPTGKSHDWRSELVAAVGLAAEGRRLVGQRQPAMAGRGRQPLHRFCAARAVVLQADQIAAW